MNTCQVSIYITHPKPVRYVPIPCGQPLAPDANFCALHEDDRIRLGGKP